MKIGCLWLGTLPACDAAVDDLLSGKSCGPAGECVAGYVCDQSNVCVPEGQSAGAGGAGNACAAGPGGAGGVGAAGGAGGLGGMGGASGGGGQGGCMSVTDCPDPASQCELPVCVGGVC